MRMRGLSPFRVGLIVLSTLWLLAAGPVSVAAAPYAALVMDARTGEVLHARTPTPRCTPPR